MTFEQLQLDAPICRALETMGYDSPLPVQEKVIPKMLKQQDLIVKSKTGSGKTASFALPILQSLMVDEKYPQALVLAPTRELAFQIKQEFDALGTYKKIKTLGITGKQPFRFQKEDLAQRCHVVIGTPGRILDHLNQGTMHVEKVRYVILDEADEMLNMNFIEDIRAIFEQLPQDRTSCIFSATYPQAIQRLSSDFLEDAKVIEIQSEQNQVDEYFYELMEEEKPRFMMKTLVKYKPESCIVFCKTQARVEELHTYLNEHHISCGSLHGGMMQEDRFSCMKQFKKGKIRVLIATDVAARGIDVEKVDLVVNYDMPSPMELYIHRIGRSGRVNEKGMAITLIAQFDDIRKEKLQEYLNRKIRLTNSNEIWSTKIFDEDIEQLSTSSRIVEDKTKELRKDVMKIYLNGGKNKKIRPGDIVGAICEIEGMTSDDIGIIQVQDHQSYVDILNGKGLLVLKGLSTIKGKKLRVQKAK